MGANNFFFIVSEITFVRLDQFLYNKLCTHGVSRERLKKIIISGGCKIDDKVCLSPSTRLKVGMHIFIQLPEIVSTLLPEEGFLEILFSDDHLAIINKPPGLTVHPAPSCQESTLVHRLLKYFPKLIDQGGLRPGIVHRIDKDTSGLLCIALTEDTRLKLSKIFLDRKINKEYLALVHGVPSMEGYIAVPLGRDPKTKVKVAVSTKGKPAHTEWRVLHRGKNDVYSILALTIQTGRTHQIRVHMKHIGHPLVGDKLYAGGHVNKLFQCNRQMLHAWKLSFEHPITGKKMNFSCLPPKDFLDTVSLLEQEPIRIVITGVVGSGKTTVLKYFEQYSDIITWSADKTVEKLYSPGGEVWNILQERYGDRFVPDKNRSVDKLRLLSALNGETEPLLDIRELNYIVHPIVLEHLSKFWREAFDKKYKYAIAEVPLWFEVDHIISQLIKESRVSSNIRPNFVIGVSCPEHIREKRLKEYRCWSSSFKNTIDNWQLHQGMKLKLCDYIIDNSGSEVQLKDNIQDIMVLIEAKVTSSKDDFRQFLQKVIT